MGSTIVQLAGLALFAGSAMGGSVYISAPFLSPTAGCSGVDFCSISGSEIFEQGAIFHSYGWITTSESSTSASIQALSTIYTGESLVGFAGGGGYQTLYGGSGPGFAEFELTWDLNVFGGWGGAWVSVPGLSQWFDISNFTESGNAWSDPIPMTWGEPFGYGFSVFGAVTNGWGDCCGGLDLKARVTGWRGLLSADGFTEAVTVVPEPESFVLIGAGCLIGFCFRRLSSTRTLRSVLPERWLER